MSRKALVLFSLTSSAVVVAEALVVPYTDQLGVGGGEAAGLFAALIGVGTIAALLMAPSKGSDVELLATTARWGLVYSLVAALVLVGATSVWSGVAAMLVAGTVGVVAVPTNQVVGRRLPKEGRAAAMTVAQGVVYASQTLAVAGASVLAASSPTHRVMTFAMLGSVAACIWVLMRPATEASAPAATRLIPGG